MGVRAIREEWVRSSAAGWISGWCPAATQCLVQAHMVCVQAGAGALHAVLGEKQGALRLQHGAKVDQPAAVALAGQQIGIGGGVGGDLQTSQPLAVALQSQSESSTSLRAVSTVAW